MYFKDLRPNMVVEMRGGEYSYVIRYVTPLQACIQDRATGGLFIVEANGAMIPHLTPNGLLV